ncbi:MAG: serine hydrolase domain-containing protein [Acidimicrobiales bacterium]
MPLRRRVTSAGLGGGVAYVVRDGETVHDVSVGAVARSTPLSVASSAKWLTAATLLTFVDEGRLRLDDPVSRWLPEFASWDPPITVRMLLDHTSGVRDQPCLWNAGGSMADCVARLAAGPREFPPGTAFSYGNASFHVVGRLLEVLGGDDFAAVVRRRLTDPLGMTATTWPGAGANPSPAAGLRTTVDDYARYLAMLLGGGVASDGRRLLSETSVAELVRNQVGAYDTSRDYSVGITRIPRYALGAWPDVVDATGATEVVSGNGGKGFYPWIDFGHHAYGVVGVQDDRGAEVAVPASQAVFREVRAAYAGT